MPSVSTTDGIKDNIHTVLSEAMYFLHKVLMLIINWRAAQVRNGLLSLR